MEAFKDASFQPNERTKPKDVLPHIEGPKLGTVITRVRMDLDVMKTPSFKGAIKIINNFVSNKYKQYHPGKDVPQDLIDEKFDVIIQRYGHFKQLNEK